MKKDTKAEIYVEEQKTTIDLVAALESYRDSIKSKEKRLEGPELARANQDRAMRVAAYASMIAESESIDNSIFDDDFAETILRETLSFIPYDSTFCRKEEKTKLASLPKNRIFSIGCANSVLRDSFYIAPKIKNPPKNEYSWEKENEFVGIMQAGRIGRQVIGEVNDIFGRPKTRGSDIRLLR